MPKRAAHPRALPGRWPACSRRCGIAPPGRPADHRSSQLVRDHQCRHLARAGPARARAFPFRGWFTCRGSPRLEVNQYRERGGQPGRHRAASTGRTGKVMIDGNDPDHLDALIRDHDRSDLRRRSAAAPPTRRPRSSFGTLQPPIVYKLMGSHDVPGSCALSTVHHLNLALAGLALQFDPRPRWAQSSPTPRCFSWAAGSSTRISASAITPCCARPSRSTTTAPTPCGRARKATATTSPSHLRDLELGFPDERGPALLPARAARRGAGTFSRAALPGGRERSWEAGR